MIAGHWMLGELVGFTNQLFDMIPRLCSRPELEPPPCRSAPPSLPAVLVAFLLALVRAAAWVSICAAVQQPSRSRGQVKIGLAAGLALAVGPHLAAHGRPPLGRRRPDRGRRPAGRSPALALGFIGVLLSRRSRRPAAHRPLRRVHHRPALRPRQQRPVSRSSGSFYSVLATTLLFAIDGHLLLVRGFLASFPAAPLTDFDLATLSQLLTARPRAVLRVGHRDRRAAARRAVPGRGRRSDCSPGPRPS